MLEIALPTLDEEGKEDSYTDLLPPEGGRGSKCITAYGKTFRGYFSFPGYLRREEVKRRMKKAGFRRFKLTHGHTYMHRRHPQWLRRHKRRQKRVSW